jgi:putative NADH-flavin reductase
MKTLAVFGASGRTGQILVRQALAEGYTLNALVRSPAKLGEHHERLTIIQGDIRDATVVEKTIAGASAVISLLGPTQGQAPGTVSAGVENILSAMRKLGVQRLIFAAGAGVGDEQDRPNLTHKAINFLLRATARTAYEDMLESVAKVRASGLAWTVVRAPMLTDDSQSGAQAGYLGRGAGMRLSRVDLASFMLRQIDSEEYLCQAPVISAAARSPI